MEAIGCTCPARTGDPPAVAELRQIADCPLTPDWARTQALEVIEEVEELDRRERPCTHTDMRFTGDGKCLGCWERDRRLAEDA